MISEGNTKQKPKTKNKQKHKKYQSQIDKSNNETLISHEDSR